VRPETLLALVTFAFASAFTPGPNNIMLAASGMNFGFRRTGPHMAGIVVGFTLVLLAAGLGLGALFAAYPQIQTVLKILGAAYLLWLAWRIATAVPAEPGTEGRARPLTFLEAALFQWINPKGLVAIFSAMSLFLRPESAFTDVMIIASVFTLTSIGSVLAWAGVGGALKGLLKSRQKVRVFNIAMALLLVASIVPMVLPLRAGPA
jgi:threonine/homoserine/homoserine lactone efflux protein